MIDPNFAGTRVRPRRIEIRLRNNGTLEASLPLQEGQALAPYLASRRGSINLTDVVWTETGKRVDQLTLSENEIVWARPLERGIPLVNVLPLERAGLLMEVVLAGGQVLRGTLPILQGQPISDYLSTVGAFPVLWSARLPDERTLGDVALNQSALRSVREVGATNGNGFWERTTSSSEATRGGHATSASAAAGAPAGEVHWLIRLARNAGLTGADALSAGPVSAITQVWNAVCAACNVDDRELEGIVARQLRLDVAPASLAGGKDAWIAQSLVERYGVRGVSDDGRTLVVATADPMNADAEQALAFACKRRIVFAVAAPRALNITPAPANAEAELETLLAEIPSAVGDGVRIEEELDPKNVETDDITSEPIIKLANLVLREAVRQGASDVHLEPDQARGLIRFRVDGVLRPFMHVPLPALHKVISRYKIVSRLDIADRIRPQDGRVRIRVDGKPYELRLSTVPTQDAEKAVIRIAGSVAEQTLDQLEVPAPELLRLRQLLSFRDGIIIVTGPTGSGKTTTLYGALHELNTGRVNIMTVEDPIERALSGLTQIQVQPRRGVTFASALRAILRQDPDIILVGEIRDLETAEIAVQAAMTGHLVLTTLHTTSAVGVVERLRDLGLDRTSLAASLRGVVAQRLARRVCGQCEGEGCDECGRSGYRGRVPLMEVLTATPPFAELVGRGALFHELQNAALASGMRPMRVVAAERVAEGITTEEEVQRVLGDAEQEHAARGTAASYGTGPAGLLPAAMVEIIDDEALDVPPVPVGGASNLPARRSDVADTQAAALRRRDDTARALMQGLDRCLAEGQSMKDALHFAAEQLAMAFDSPLAWIATLDDGALTLRARAGSCAPYVRDIVPDWQDLDTSDGAVATALRTGEPQGRHVADEPGFERWGEYARMHGLPIFLAVPMMGPNGPLGLVGLHARGMDGLDQQAGRDLMSLVDRVGTVIGRLRQIEAAGLQVAALELAADAVFTTDRRGVIQWVNRSFIQLSGYTAAEAVGQTPRILRSQRHDAAFYKEMWDTILAGRAWRGELYNLRKDGTAYAVEQTITPITDASGQATHFLSVQRDITERKQREESVRQLVTSDPLTGLPNSRALNDELGRVIAAAAEGGAEAALLLISIDGGTALRDSAGPAVADQLVNAIAPVLRDTVRPGDFLARIGEDEFAALLPRTPQDGAYIAADRLREAVARDTAAVPGLDAQPSVSIGISIVDGTLGTRAVLATADAALYGSRERREGVIVLHTGAAEAEEDSGDEEWARRIRTALQDDHFFLHFQPVVRLSTGAVSHYDALLRLYDDDGDIIPARAFIAHAENLGLMPQIDRWVVENVLRLLHTSPGLSVSLNLGTSTVLNPAFRQFMQRQSRRMSAVGTRIIFEVSEAGAAQDLPRMLDNMNRLRELGCRFALDNFGIGGTSLASLGTLPVDYVKVDGSLIRGVDLDEDRFQIVAALTTVARALGKEVIAGWAERESIVQLLPDLGIELAQGHYLGAPAPELQRDHGSSTEMEPPWKQAVGT